MSKTLCLLAIRRGLEFGIFDLLSCIACEQKACSRTRATGSATKAQRVRTIKHCARCVRLLSAFGVYLLLQGDMPDGGATIQPDSDDPPRPVKKFTWQDLSKLNRRDNAHVAVRGKV